MPQWIHTLTVDASYHFPTRVTGIGIVVQERLGRSGRGPIVDRIAEAHRNVPAGAGELFALVRALELASDRAYTHVKTRSDYNQLRKALRDKHRRLLPADGLEGRVLQLARTFAWLDFGYVPRRKNQIAHSLARAGRLQTPDASPKTILSAHSTHASSANLAQPACHERETHAEASDPALTGLHFVSAGFHLALNRR